MYGLFICICLYMICSYADAYRSAPYQGELNRGLLMQVCLCAFIHAHIHAYIHTCSHEHTHTYTAPRRDRRHEHTPTSSAPLRHTRIAGKPSAHLRSQRGEKKTKIRHHLLRIGPHERPKIRHSAACTQAIFEACSGSEVLVSRVYCGRAAVWEAEGRRCCVRV